MNFRQATAPLGEKSILEMDLKSKVIHHGSAVLQRPDRNCYITECLWKQMIYELHCGPILTAVYITSLKRFMCALQKRVRFNLIHHETILFQSTGAFNILKCVITVVLWRICCKYLISSNFSYFSCLIYCQRKKDVMFSSSEM